MTAAKDGPSAKRADTQSPFAVLAPRAASREIPAASGEVSIQDVLSEPEPEPDAEASEAGRPQTGTRVRISAGDVELESAASLANTSLANTSPANVSLDPSISTDSLKKPFASLLPNKPTSLPPVATSGARPAPPSQLFAEMAAARQPAPAPNARSGVVAKRPDPTAPLRHGVCKTHGTALTSEGKCVLCTREATRQRGAQRKRRVVGLFVVVALACGLVYLTLDFLAR